MVSRRYEAEHVTVRLRNSDIAPCHLHVRSRLLPARQLSGDPARGTPRGLFGKSGSMIDHSESVSSYRPGVLIEVPPGTLNHHKPCAATPL
jgi:hypothetical protein